MSYWACRSILEFGIYFFEILLNYHRQLYAFAVFIDFGYFYFNVLVQFNHFIDIAHKTSFELGNVYQTAFFDSDIDKTAKIGDVVYDSGQNHPCFQIFNGFDIRVEFKDFGRFSWVQSWFFELFEDVFDTQNSNFGRHVVFGFDERNFFFVGNQISNSRYAKI